MRSPLYFVLWRCGLIGLLGFVVSELHGWRPAPLLILVMFAIAGDSVATLWSLTGGTSGRSTLNGILERLRRR